MLAIEDVRVDVGGVPDVEGITLRSESARVAIVGAGRGLVRAIAGELPLARGSVSLEGKSVASLVSAGELATLLADVPLPPRWTALEHATWSGRLAGEERGGAIALEVLRELGVDPNARLAKPSPELRAATVIAGAFATGARALILEDPLRALSHETARAFRRALAKRLEDKVYVFFTAILPLASPLAIDECFLVRGSQVIARGAPAEIAARERTYAVRAAGDVASWSKRVEGAGGHVSGGGEALPSSELRVELGDSLEVRDLFVLAEEERAVVLEVVPLSRALP